jgi:hypothetical protein
MTLQMRGDVFKIASVYLHAIEEIGLQNAKCHTVRLLARARAYATVRNSSPSAVGGHKVAFEFRRPISD